MNGRLEVAVTGSGVERLAGSPPLAAKLLTGPLGPELLLVGAAASLLEGDRVEVVLRLAPGASLSVRTVAATLAHPCPGAGRTSFDVDVEMGEGSRLAWLPEPLVACAGCRHRSRSSIRLGPGAQLLWSETVALGRSGEQPGEVELRLDADLDGAPLLRDGLRIGPPAPAWDGPAVLDGARHLGTIALLGSRHLSSPLPAPEVPGMIMDLAGPGALFRALGGDGAAVERELAPVRRQWLTVLAGGRQIPTRSAQGASQAMVM